MVLMGLLVTGQWQKERDVANAAPSVTQTAMRVDSQDVCWDFRLPVTVSGSSCILEAYPGTSSSHNTRSWILWPTARRVSGDAGPNSRASNASAFPCLSLVWG